MGWSWVMLQKVFRKRAVGNSHDEKFLVVMTKLERFLFTMTLKSDKKIHFVFVFIQQVTLFCYFCKIQRYIFTTLSFTSVGGLFSRIING